MPAIEDEVMESVWATLEAKRREVEEVDPDTGDHFYVTVRGGCWTKAHTGKAYDSFSGQARGGTPREFCALYGMRTMASFATSKYGEVASSTMAHEWCRKMEHFFAVWMGQDSWEYAFSSDDAKAYHSPDQFV